MILSEKELREKNVNNLKQVTYTKFLKNCF